MRYFKFLIVLLGLVVPALAHADASNIPASATWYFHADIDAMRGGKASRSVYDWLNAEVFEEIREETGIDLDKEADRMTHLGNLIQRKGIQVQQYATGAGFLSAYAPEQPGCIVLDLQPDIEATLVLQERLTIYPAFLRQPDRFLDPSLTARIADMARAEGPARHPCLGAKP